MEINYRRDPNKSTMIVSGVGQGVLHEERMIEENNIPSILSFSKSNSVEGREFWFDITGRKSLKNFFAQEGISPDSIYEGIKSIQEGLDELGKYLISPKSLLFTPETIYLKWENLRWKAAFAYAPGVDGDFSMGLLSLFEYLIRNVDHENSQAVSLCYTLFEKVSRGDITLSDILNDIEPVLIKRSPYIEPKEESGESFVASTDKVDEIPVIEENIERPSWYDSDDDIFEKAPPKKGILDWVFSKEKPSRKKKKNEERGFWEEKEVNYILEDLSEDGVKSFGGTTLLSSESSLGRRLVYEGSGRLSDMKIESTPFLIGSNKESCDGVIMESVVSRAHARIIKKDEDYYIEDLESKNGTFLNGQILDFNKQAKLSLGDAISFANIGYRFM